MASQNFMTTKSSLIQLVPAVRALLIADRQTKTWDMRFSWRWRHQCCKAMWTDRLTLTFPRNILSPSTVPKTNIDKMRHDETHRHFPTFFETPKARYLQKSATSLCVSRQKPAMTRRITILTALLCRNPLRRWVLFHHSQTEEFIC
jgi:hypothetical protein